MIRRLRLSRSIILSRMAHSGAAANRLAGEKSPYLLQHAHNPVAWFPWGEEAFDAARRDNKLIFLSIGYSTCHWCHVMERESFENEEVAQLLNNNFISIKVDREERPDIDKIYMTYVQVTSGGGGWPLSVWLTPNLKPVLGGTYFPPEDNNYGRPGIKTILTTLKEKWNSPKGEKILADSERMTQILSNASNPPMNEEAAEQFEVSACVKRCLDMLKRNFDDLGYGRQEPKFPQCVNGNFLFNVFNFQGEMSGLPIVKKQLKAMATGGIHDHLGGGFHRYSVDSKWHVPHFEKMLYDQAQLLTLYASALKIPGIAKEEALFFDTIAVGIADYVVRDLSHPEGGFYTAEDADSFENLVKEKDQKKEGAFYVWTWSELHEVLSDGEAKVFSEFFAIEEQGNVDPQLDPHGELLNQNILYYRYPDWIYLNSSDLAKLLDLDVEEPIKDVLNSAKNKLLQRRLETRPRPHLDTKIVTAWNGLMIGAMAKASRNLRQPEYAQRAMEAVEFIKKYLYDADTRTLYRSTYTEDGAETAQIKQLIKPIEGVLEDYVFLIFGLLELYDAVLDESLLTFAKDLQDSQDNLFWDQEKGGYFLSSKNTKDIIYNVKDDQDASEPSANSVTIANLVRLEAIFAHDDYREKASKTIKLFAERLSKVPIALPEMVSSLLYHSTPPTKIILSSPDDNVLEFKRICDLEGRGFCIIHKAHSDSVLGFTQQDYPPLNGRLTAYICKDFSCLPPITDPSKFRFELHR